MDVNEAFISLVGMGRAALIGRDPIDLQPPDDQEANRAQRSLALAELAQGRACSPLRHRWLHPAGRDVWIEATPINIAPADRPAVWLNLVQDHSAEQSARLTAQRVEAELSQWFEVSRDGAVVFDSTGLILRFNDAFEALVGEVPQTLAEASPDLQALLAWRPAGGYGPAATALDGALQPGAAPLETQATVRRAGGAGRRLSARLTCHESTSGGLGGDVRRVLAVVQDRSVEDQRDLALLELDLLKNTASIGVTTFDATDGLKADGDVAGLEEPVTAATPSSASLAIGREWVEAASLPDFDRLQLALRRSQRAEVRYAVQHPAMGRRLLLTRIEPGALASGGSTTSIVTLDVTEQDGVQRRNEQLLHELTTILDTSTAGIAYLRGPALVRCNLRFERMLGFEPGAAAGASLAEIFVRGRQTLAAGQPGALPQADAVLQVLAQGQPFETELSRLAADGQGLLWYSLSLRLAGGQGQLEDAVAVLTDITRLKRQQSELEKLLRDRELMFNLSEVGIVYQRGARIERANQAMAELSGWGSSELSTLDVAELYASARECVEFEARITQALRERGRFVGERNLRRSDGHTRWVQVAVRPVDAADVQSGVICSFVDIEERRRARQSLSQQAERTRSMLNSVLVGIVTVSERGIEWMNRSARRMFAGELAGFLGQPISLVATPEPDHPLRRGDWLQRLREGRVETFECRLRGRDGREFWVVGSAMLNSSGYGGEHEVTFALLDIEARRQAEISVARTKAMLQRVIETAPMAIALFDARSLRLQQFNHTAGEFFGRPLLALTGSSLEELCEPAQAKALRAWLEAVAQGEGARAQEWREFAASEAAEPMGEPWRVWDCRIAPMAEEQGAVSQLLLVASDVTQQREAERARLQAAIDQRELLVREVHHRIKNNLQGVAGLLQQTAVRRPGMAGDLNEAVSQVQAIAQVHGLQVGGGGPLGAAGLLRAIAQSVQRTFGTPIEVELEGRVPHLLPEAESIPVALTVNELLTNAIKHGRGQKVTCTLMPRGEGLCVRVASAGELASGFDLKRVPAGVSGLGLVRALLPRRSSTLSLHQVGGQVVAEVELRPPSVCWPPQEPRDEHDQRQLEL